MHIIQAAISTSISWDYLYLSLRGSCPQQTFSLTHLKPALPCSASESNTVLSEISSATTFSSSFLYLSGNLRKHKLFLKSSSSHLPGC